MLGIDLSKMSVWLNPPLREEEGRETMPRARAPGRSPAM